MSGNIITAAEMAAATDANSPVTPAKFLPYRKLCDEMKKVVAGLDAACTNMDKLAALFTATSCNPEIGDAGTDLAVIYCNRLFKLKERAASVLGSALLTLPRKRWQESGCPDDRPDDDDVAREDAAAVPPDGGDGD
jgi:hypothetical protein